VPVDGAVEGPVESPLNGSQAEIRTCEPSY
jgi:hypothetical protein